MTHAWTAAEVWELVKDWPDSARADGMRYVPAKPGQPDVCAKWCNHDGRVPTAHATALHVASGIGWLAAVDVVEVQFDHEADWLLCRWRDVDGNSRIVGQHTGPTILHAIAAAIRATKGETR